MFNKTQTERRRPVTCDSCGVTMVFADEVLRSVDGRETYLKYVCPHRAGEPGCGRTKAVMFGREPRVRLRKTPGNNFIKG